jgi:hypothetical protein
MFRGWRTARRAHSAHAPLGASDRSVRDAEEIVRQAWRLELLRQRDRMQFALRAADHDVDTAHEVLAAVQRDGDPYAIAAAHDALQQALETARRSAAACERTSQALRTELDLLAGAGTARPVTAPVYRLGADRSAPTAQASRAPGAPFRAVRRLLVVLPSEGGAYRWLWRLAMGRTTALGER